MCRSHPCRFPRTNPIPISGRIGVITLPRPGSKGRASYRSVIGVDGTIRVFRSRMPGGFADPKYVGNGTNGEGTYKRAAAQKFQELIVTCPHFLYQSL